MSMVDKIYKETCRKILEEGFDTTGQNVRGNWPDGTRAYTKKLFGVVNEYDLSKEFPLLTIRPISLRGVVEELLWTWQKKSNNINDFNLKIWDAWADENGLIGKTYGYQLGVKHQYKEGEFDQVDRLIYDLKNNPYSRRIITNTYVHQDLHEMRLYPCVYSMTFNVVGDKLNAILNQRSADILAAGNWDVVQHAVLIHMIAQVTGFKPGKLLHVIADCHIYDRHIPTVEKLLDAKEFPAPKFSLNPDIKNFYDFKHEDFILTDYVAGPDIPRFEVSI
ncbi:MAG TPA: thymidylate synthase [Clostridiales bacterium]|nr:MAG: thymidylate synthase [Clostridiales bacterium GWD2_32_59]HAN09920.1 thymidylate synthase [Clostridiales bacterium]